MDNYIAAQTAYDRRLPPDESDGFDDYQFLLETSFNPSNPDNVLEAISDDALEDVVSQIGEAMSLGDNLAVGALVNECITKYWQRRAKKEAGIV